MAALPARRTRTNPHLEEKPWWLASENLVDHIQRMLDLGPAEIDGGTTVSARLRRHRIGRPATLAGGKCRLLASAPRVLHPRGPRGASRARHLSPHPLSPWRARGPHRGVTLVGTPPRRMARGAVRGVRAWLSTKASVGRGGCRPHTRPRTSRADNALRAGPRPRSALRGRWERPKAPKPMAPARARRRAR